MEIESGLEAKVGELDGAYSKTLGFALGIKFEFFSRRAVVATMSVDERTRQPFGLLHGGASVALAETVASIGGWLNIDETKFSAVGIEINANHIRALRSGTVKATASPIHIGSTTQVWGVEIVDERGKIVCVSRCTLAIVKNVNARTEPEQTKG